MAPGAEQAEDAAFKRRMELAGASGPKAFLQNLRVVGIAAFACLGGLLYGYNQGVFSGKTLHQENTLTFAKEGY